MKVMALRIAAYLLILQFVIVAALDFVGKSGPDYIHLLVALGLLITSSNALFSPRRRGWMAVAAYAVLILARPFLGLAAALADPSTSMAMKLGVIVAWLVIESPVIAALILVFKPANFAAFATPAPSTVAAQKP